jgi:hypothetical protein
MAERNGNNPQNTTQTIKSVAIRIPKGKHGVNVDIQEDQIVPILLYIYICVL